MSGALAEYAKLWRRKPVLRMIYEEFYERIVGACIPGVTLEIGGGVGNLKQRLAHVITTDVQFAKWIDCVADAQMLPFADSVS